MHIFFERVGLAVLLAMTGCVTTYLPTATSDEFRKSYRHMYQPLFERAVFDLNCELESLTFKKLGDHSHVGVEGCGARAVYVFAGYEGWVLNNTSTQQAPTNGEHNAPDPGSE